MSTPADIFIDLMREARVKRGITIEDLSEKTGIPAHSLKRWEDGGQKPRIQSAFKLAAILGYRIELVAAK